MNIAVVGLGLIGGSFAKAITEKTDNVCFGIDTDTKTVNKAVEDGTIKAEISAEELSSMDMVLVSLHPESTVDFISNNAQYFKKGCIVADTCGIKGYIVNSCEKLLSDKGVFFVGCHPMAGREYSGYDYSKADMFHGASFIVTKTSLTDEKSMDTICSLAEDIGFGRIVVTDIQLHDRTIAYTSQLAHIASNAYVKSPSLMLESGFTGGSFQDLTRVARLNENMWTELFIENGDNLISELDNYIENLQQYSIALKNRDNGKLRELLREGRELKEKVND